MSMTVASMSPLPAGERDGVWGLHGWDHSAAAHPHPTLSLKGEG
jgi:hypothetical protein